MLQTITAVRESGTYNFLGNKIVMQRYWNLELFDELLIKFDYHDTQIVSLLKYGCPISRQVLPITQARITKNHLGAREHPVAIQSYISKESEAKCVIGPFNSIPFTLETAISPLNTVPKKESDERRVVVDMSSPPGSSVNDGIDKEIYLDQKINLVYPTVDHFVSMIKKVGPGALIYKIDLKKFYRQIPVCPSSIPYLGYSWKGKFYFDTVLAMGCTSSAYIAQRVSNAISFLHNKIGGYSMVYLDDFMGVARPQHVFQQFNNLRQLLKDLNITESVEKAVPPTTVAEVLGVGCDTKKMVLFLFPQRVADLKNEMALWYSKKVYNLTQLQSLIGKLQFAAKVIKAGRVFISRLLECLVVTPPSGYHPVPPELLQDLQWWQAVMPSLNGQFSMYTQIFNEDTPVIQSDACLSGGGAVCFNKFYFHTRLPYFVFNKKFTIAQLEFRVLVAAVKHWLPKLANSKFVVKMDNELAVQAINSGRSRDHVFHQCMRELAFLAAKYNFVVKAFHIPGVKNVLPDLLSRWYSTKNPGVARRQFYRLTRKSGLKQQPLQSHLFHFDNPW